MTKDQLRFVIGENIRKERTMRGISTDELAEMLDLSPSFVGLIERGGRGTTPIILYKLSNVFGVSIETFFEKVNSHLEKKSGKTEKIISLVFDFTDKELDFIISVIKGVRVMHYENQGNFAEK